MAREYEVEVKLRADPERVWRALTDQEDLAQWFGWDAPGLADEIQFIFFDHSSADPGRMRLEAEGLEGQFVEVVSEPDGSLIRAVQPGEPGPDHDFDGMREGWTALFFQLRRYLDDHAGGARRRTVYLSGNGDGAKLAAAVDERLGGERWFRGSHTVVTATEDFGNGMGALSSEAAFDRQAPDDSPEDAADPPADGDDLPADGDDPAPDGSAKVSFTLSTFGLERSWFEQVRDDWFEWWQEVTAESEMTTADG